MNAGRGHLFTALLSMAILPACAQLDALPKAVIAKADKAEPIADEFAAEFQVNARPRSGKIALSDNYWRLQRPCSTTSVLRIENSEKLKTFFQKYLYANNKQSTISIATSAAGSVAPEVPLFASVRSMGSVKQVVIDTQCSGSPYYTKQTLGDNQVKVALKFIEKTEVSLLETLARTAAWVAPLYTGPHGVLISRLATEKVGTAGATIDARVSEFLSHSDSASSTLRFNPEMHEAVDFVANEPGGEKTLVFSLLVERKETLLSSDGTIAELDNLGQRAPGQAKLRPVSGKQAGLVVPGPPADLTNGPQFTEYCGALQDQLVAAGFTEFDAALLTLGALETRQWTGTLAFRNSSNSYCEDRLTNALERAPQIRDSIKSVAQLRGEIRTNVQKNGKENFNRVARALRGGVSQVQSDDYWTSNVEFLNESADPAVLTALGIKKGATDILTSEQANAIFASNNWLKYTANPEQCMKPGGLAMDLAKNTCFWSDSSDTTSRIPLAIHVTLTDSREVAGVKIKSVIVRDL